MCFILPCFNEALRKVSISTLGGAPDKLLISAEQTSCVKAEETQTAGPESRGCEAIEVDEGPVTKALGFYIVDSFTGLSGGDIF